MVTKKHIAVIGAGVVGLAVARQLAEAGRQVTVFEQHAEPGQEVSGHNSEIIHAGIYYITGSLKAELAVRGKDLLYAYCAEKNIAHRRCGKVIIATDASQHPKLESLLQKAVANGAGKLEQLDTAAIRRKIPAARGTAALFSPETGILSVRQLLAALMDDARRAGTEFHFNTLVQRAGQRAAGGLWLETADKKRFEFDSIVNAAGLYAARFLDGFENFPAAQRVPSFLAKGNYFRLTRAIECPHLLYPLPEPGGLGIHLTFDLAGQQRFGPDVEWVNAPDYIVNAGRRDAFHAAIQKYLPDIKANDLVPFFAGVRPKITGPDTADADFLLEDESAHGIPGLVNLLGIESPGLTSCLAIAERVAAKL